MRQSWSAVAVEGFQHHPPNVCEVAVLPLKASLADSVIFWWKTLQDDVLVLVVRGALLGGDGTEAVAAPVLLVEKVIGVFILPHIYRFHFSVCRSQGIARSVIELLT